VTITEAVGHVRPLTSSDLVGVFRLLDQDPVAHCFVASRVRVAGVDPWRLGGDILGYFTSGGLESVVYCGANLVPVSTTPASRASFADRLRRMGRRCSSLVGRSDEVLDLWRLLEPSWGPAREVRSNQPVMVIDGPPVVEADPLVREATMDDLDVLVPACIEMFTVEVGVSPTAGGGASGYRARIAEIVQSHRSFVRIEGDIVVFKAEVGAVGDGVCQVQGVWVDPRFRGRRLSIGGMAAVVDLSRQRIAPTVSLYVNDYNTAARKAYRSVGFREEGSFATVLF
jgi:predicted GNAT family acetyltransferase